MNFTDFYSKLFKNLYDCNFILILIKENNVRLLQKYGNLTRSEFCGIFASLVLVVATAKTSEFHPNQFIFIILLRHIGSVVFNF